MNMIEIKNRDNGAVIHSGEFDSVMDCLNDGIRKGVRFHSADMIQALLVESERNSTDLTHVDLKLAKLLENQLDRWPTSGTGEALAATA